MIILAERDAIAWVVSRRRMAFTADRGAAASAVISVGDEIFLYATRRAFHDPTHDRGRVFGRAHATSGVQPFNAPVRLIRKEFTHGFTFEFDTLAAPRQGIALAELVPQLSTFSNKQGWGMLLRRPLLSLTPEDARLIRRRLTTERGDLAHRVELYLAEARTTIPSI
jgi:hypothetical protein